MSLIRGQQAVVRQCPVLPPHFKSGHSWRVRARLRWAKRGSPDFAREGEAYLSAGENVRTISYMPGSKRRDRERLFEKRQRSRIPAHRFIVLRTAPLRIHRHPRALEASVKGRGDKAGRPADEFIYRARKQIEKSALVGRIYREGKTLIRVIMPLGPLASFLSSCLS